MRAYDSTGLDYHFHREEIYMTQADHNITRISVTLVESTQLNLMRISGNYTNIIPLHRL